ncbi:MAG: hypothetical protein SWO11_07365 [Thermodesulfobacteriota bacterium]|nr:hypothetical protein [Thermodesulfobacteriota bacterium]
MNLIPVGEEDLCLYQGQSFLRRWIRYLLRLASSPFSPSLSKMVSPTFLRGGLLEIKTGTRTYLSDSMIFTGGDAVTGPDKVVGAIAAGHNAADEIDAAIRKFYSEPPYMSQLEEEIEIPIVIDEETTEMQRASIPEALVTERIKGSRNWVLQENCYG